MSVNTAVVHPARLSRKADAIALGIGSKITASTLMMACVLTIVLGAASMLDALISMDSDLKRMSRNLDEANGGLAVLNKTMDSLGPTNAHMDSILVTVKDTHTEVKRAGANVATLSDRTGSINTKIEGIATSTTTMRMSLENLDGSTGELEGTVTDLSGRIEPLAATQSQMLGEVRNMREGMNGMNASLAYSIRMLNYMTAPPLTKGFTVKAVLDPRTLPPIPGVAAETEPIAVYPRNFWPVYTGL